MIYVFWRNYEDSCISTFPDRLGAERGIAEILSGNKGEEIHLVVEGFELTYERFVEVITKVKIK